MNHSFTESAEHKINTVQNKNLDLNEFRKRITLEIHKCNYRGLKKSAEWLIDVLKSKGLDMCQDTSVEVFKTISPYMTEYIDNKIKFDNNEFLRCSHFLKDFLRKNDTLDFLYFYSRYKACLKLLYESEIDWINNESQREISALICLKEDIEEYISEYAVRDAYIFYLHGIILKKLQLKDEAVKVFIKAISQNEYLWPAWYELSDIIDYVEIHLPSNWMRRFFDVKRLKQDNSKLECDKAINRLMQSGFDNVVDLKIDLAMVNEEVNNSVYSLELFNDIHKKDPHRLDYMCTFSNILFVQENRKQMAELVQACVKTDRYRYETCCVIANFYSLDNKHEKSLIYFQRALKMNSSNSNLWLLTAHEYFELENYSSAINCYSKAITFNPKCHRARYGLGQLYEMLKIYKCALNCYQKAFELMPNDSRILVALGTVYEELGQYEESKSCYYRAKAIGDVEHCALIKLGKLFEKLKDLSQAAATFTLFIEEVEESGFIALQNLSYAYMFLANYHWKCTKNIEKARTYAMKCCEIPEIRMAGRDLLWKITGDRDDQEETWAYVENIFMSRTQLDDSFSNTTNESKGSASLDMGNGHEMRN